ncbi:glycosyltransferase family 2 protein [Cloacibacillus evryensis]|uniref:glycosyltransferase family 2 protein n=1 Tax=Cloacibacillus evryensis TaxID=508460 RepID=UPI00370DB676
MEPKVSICCITYNHEKFIRCALDSFINKKTNFGYEIIVHDDASTDGTSKIIREYEQNFPEIVKPIYQKTNQYSKKVPILSICLPTYNRSKVIERQVKDIIAQTAEIEDDIEVLLSDNASTDDTRILIEPLCFPNSKIKYYRQKTNLGGEGNFLFLAKKSTAKYYWCIGDDDIIRPGTVAYVVSILKEYNDIGAIVLKCGGVYPSLSTKHVRWRKADFSIDDKCLINYVPEVLKIHPNFPVDTDWMFITKCILQRDAYIKIAEDKNFQGNCALSLFATCVSIKNKNFYYANKCGYITGFGGTDNWHSKADKVCQDIISGIRMLDKFGFSCEEKKCLFISEEPHLYYVNTLGCMEKGMSIRESLESNFALQKQLEIPVSEKAVFDGLRKKDPECTVFLVKEVLKIAYNQAPISLYLKKRAEAKRYNYLPPKLRELKWVVKYMVIINLACRLRNILKNGKKS